MDELTPTTLMKQKLYEAGFMLSVSECNDILSNVHQLPKAEQKIDLVRYCRSYPFNEDAINTCKNEMRIYTCIPHVCYTTHTDKRYVPVESDGIFSKRELELLSLSKKKNLKYHDNSMKNVIYAAVFRHGSVERFFIGKATNVKTRWGTTGQSHFAVVRNVIQNSNFLFCNPLLVDLYLACFPVNCMKLFIIDQLDYRTGKTLDELERYYITNHFKDEEGNVINLEASLYGLNMQNESRF